MAEHDPGSIHSDEPQELQRHHEGWAPKDTRLLSAWIHKEILCVESQDKAAREEDNRVDRLDDVIDEFITLIESDPVISTNFNEMIAAVKLYTNVPNSPETSSSLVDGGPRCKIENYRRLMVLLNHHIQGPPRFERLGETEVVGIPIYALLDPYMNTTAGATAFLNPKVNAQFKKLLNVWSSRLVTPESRSVLTTEDKGWLSKEAIAQLEQVAQGPFAETFVCDPSKPHWGFKSWDDFFTRRFREDVPNPPRPIFRPCDDSRVNAACESTVYRIATNVNHQDQFWITGQPYSLQHMLNNNLLSCQLIGGTIFQAFLSPFNYHRWHSPVNGRIVDAYVVDGSYYASVPDNEGSGSIVRSQAFITCIAARALIFIECVNANIGLMCFIGVGMGEVSSCELFVKKGDIVRKGAQIGSFHYGGSSHCLLFGPNTGLNFRDTAQPGCAILVNSEIACVPDV